MRPRVLLVCREHVGHWVPFYVEAFKAAANTLTIGPPLDLVGLRAARREELAAELLPNDIACESGHLPDLLSHLPAGWEPDLVVAVQSSLPPLTGMAEAPCPTAYISIDTWHDHAEFAVARQFDQVFVAQPAFVPYFQDTGARHVQWLPLAAAPHRHFPVDFEPVADVAFVGAVHFAANIPRYLRLQALGQRFRLIVQTALTAEQTSGVYAQAHLAFNASISREINMRVFEVLAMRRPLVMNRDAAVNGLFELFGDDEHLITYRGDEDLLEVVQGALEDPARRARIAEAGWREVMERHTYGHRIAAILEGAALLQRLTGTPPGNLAARLPHRPGRVLDVGCHLERSKVALRHAGATRVDGVLLPGTSATPHARRYDAVAAWPDTPAPTYDTVVCGAPRTFQRDLAALLAWAGVRLAAGGVLLLRLPADEVAHLAPGRDVAYWAAWTAEHGFHQVGHARPEPERPWHDLTLRRYTRSDEEVSAEIYTRFPVPRPEDYGMPTA